MLGTGLWGFLEIFGTTSSAQRACFVGDVPSGSLHRWRFLGGFGVVSLLSSSDADLFLTLLLTLIHLVLRLGGERSIIQMGVPFPLMLVLFSKLLNLLY